MPSKRFTIHYDARAQADLARLWNRADKDSQASITRAEYQIHCLLRWNADRKGRASPNDATLRVIEHPPLRACYTVFVDDLRVLVWGFSRM